MPLGKHHAHLVLEAQDRTEHIGIEGGGVGFGRLLGQRSRLSFGTSVVHRNIQPAKALDRPVDEIAHVIFVAHIGAHEFRFGAKSAQFRDQCLPIVLAPTGNDDARTFLSERNSGRAGRCRSARP